MVAVPWLDLVVSGRTLAESDVVLTTDWWLAGALSPRGTLGAEAEEKERPRNTYQNTRQFKVKFKPQTNQDADSGVPQLLVPFTSPFHKQQKKSLYQHLINLCVFSTVSISSASSFNFSISQTAKKSLYQYLTNQKYFSIISISSASSLNFPIS